MLCSEGGRADYLHSGSCPDCGGCIDDQCRGCGRRFCTGTYEAWAWTMPEDRKPGSWCNRCPEKVAKYIDVPGGVKEIQVRCNADTGHTGVHHWNPHLAGRTEQ